MGVSSPTVQKYLKWSQRKNLIRASVCPWIACQLIQVLLTLLFMMMPHLSQRIGRFTPKMLRVSFYHIVTQMPFFTIITVSCQVTICNRNQHISANAVKSGFQEGVFIFANPAHQKNHVEAFTYLSSVQGRYVNQRFPLEMW